MKSEEDKDKYHIKKIVCGADHTVLLYSNGTVFTWGRNNFGQCGLGTKDDIVKEPTKVDLEDVRDVACGANHTLFLLRDGSVFACGLAKDDRFYSKGGDHEFKPTKLEGFDKYRVVGLSCGKRHSMFIAEEK